MEVRKPRNLGYGEGLISAGGGPRRVTLWSLLTIMLHMDSIYTHLQHDADMDPWYDGVFSAIQVLWPDHVQLEGCSSLVRGICKPHLLARRRSEKSSSTAVGTKNASCHDLLYRGHGSATVDHGSKKELAFRCTADSKRL